MYQILYMYQIFLAASVEVLVHVIEEWSSQMFILLSLAEETFFKRREKIPEDRGERTVLAFVFPSQPKPKESIKSGPCSCKFHMKMTWKGVRVVVVVGRNQEKHTRSPRRDQCVRGGEGTVVVFSLWWTDRHTHTHTHTSSSSCPRPSFEWC